MALVMLTEKQPLFPIVVRRKAFELLSQQALLEQLFFDPNRQGHAKRAEPAGCERQIGLEQSFEFQERLVVKDDIVDLAELDTSLLKTIPHCILRKTRVVLLAGETLLLGRCGNTPLHDKGGRTVVVKGRDSEDVHYKGNLKQCVDEGRNNRSLAQHEQPAKDGHHYHDRQHPEFLADPHEGPQLQHERHLCGHLRIDASSSPGSVPAALVKSNNSRHLFHASAAMRPCRTRASSTPSAPRSSRTKMP